MINKTERENPPFAEEMGSFSFPEFKVLSLSGGVKVYLVKNKKQPLINIRILPEKGSADVYIPGLTSFSMQMLINGTKNRSAEKTADDAEFLGAKLNASAKWDYSVLSITSLSDFTEESLDLLEDCLFNPAFSEDEIQRQKMKVLAEIQQYNADPNRLARLAFNSFVHKDSPYEHQISGTVSTVSAVEKQDILNWHDDLLNETHISIIVSGYFDEDAIMKKLEKRFGKLKSAEKQQPFEYELNQNGTSAVIIEKKGASQVSLRIGRKTLNPRNPEYPALQTASVIFGGYFLSRINHLLREKLGYTYGVNTAIDSRKHSSFMVTASSLKTDAANDSAVRILSELKKMSAEPVNREELFRASQFVLGSFLRSVESPQQTASLIMGIINHSLDFDYYDYMYNKIKSLSTDELFEVQKKYFNPENLVIAASGEKEHLASSLSMFGDMYEADTEGLINKL